MANVYYSQPYEITGTLTNGQTFVNDFTLTYAYSSNSASTTSSTTISAASVTIYANANPGASVVFSSANDVGTNVGGIPQNPTPPSMLNPLVGTSFVGQNAGSSTLHVGEVFAASGNDPVVSGHLGAGSYEMLRFSIVDSNIYNAKGSPAIDAVSAAAVPTIGSTIHLDANTLLYGTNLSANYVDAFVVNGGTSPTAYFDKLNGIVCYAKGTLIQTERGYIAVEKLKVGDGVLTVAGSYEPIVWLGHRTVDCKRHPNQAEAHPVRICKDAFGPNQPSRDLYLSPLHSVYVDGILIPAIDLVNGVTVLQEVRSKITYYHVELPTHNAIYAEGLTAESYLDDSNRNFFIDDSTGQLVDMTAQFAEKQTTAQDTKESSQWFATVLRNGPEVEAVKARLEANANGSLKRAA